VDTVFEWVVFCCERINNFLRGQKMKRLMISLVMMVMSSVAHAYVYSDYTWHTYNGHQYAATFTVGPWEPVQAEAAAIGANLVTINDAAENAWLTEIFDEIVIPGHYDIWIGLREDGGVWSWLSGEPVTYWNVCDWCFRDPGPHMYLHTASHTYPGTWNYNNWHDTRPTHHLHGIIEISEPPCWVEQAKLTASDRTPGDMFGVYVSTSGDYAISGAWWDDDNGTDSGSAYVFEKPVTGWVDATETAKLIASDAAAGDNFGRSVSVNGDWAIVGAYADNDKGTNSGSAYVFKKPAGGWVDMMETAKLIASDAAAGDNFGVSASMSGGYAIIGANFEDAKGVENSGSAYILKRDGTSWIEQNKLMASDGEIGDEFGYAVSISGDYAIVGAYRDNDNGTDSGSAYIFKRDGETWVEQEKLRASDGVAYDRCGFCVSISGGYAIVGAYKDDDDGESSGSAYIFKRDGINWIQQTKLTASDASAGDRFGYSVSISEDCAAVGAYADDNNGNDSGSAYIFRRDGTSWIEQNRLFASEGNNGDYFGVSISISRDHTVVGAQEDDSSTGSGYVFENICEPPIEALIDIDPDTLNKKSHGRWVTVYITLPDGYDVGAIDTSSIAITSLVGETCDPEYTQGADLSFVPQVGDRDEDGIADLTVRFDRQVLLANLCLDDVAVTIEGELTTGEHFSGSDTIRIIDRGK
jgi:hypothetical protein